MAPVVVKSTLPLEAVRVSAGAGSVTMSWTWGWGNENLAHIAFNLKTATGCPACLLRYYKILQESVSSKFLCPRKTN